MGWDWFCRLMNLGYSGRQGIRREIEELAARL